jgi:glycosyltransferase involved in cell wall biosynthesis
MISVIMATYNRADTIQRAIDSVLRQSHTDWELLIVDDGSTDATSELLEALDDSRIRIYRHPQNRGMHAAKNTGLDHISGEWFTTLDADDEMVPEALEVMLACAERTGATAITCNCVDTTTGRFSGTGPTADGRLTPEQTARCRGDFWGMTQTDLLGELRFDERVPNHQAPVWIKINRKARRYYLHRALAIVHTEGADRITKTSRTTGLRRKTDTYCYLGEDAVYLRELKKVDPSGYRHMIIRVWAARVLRPLLGIFPHSHRYADA